MALTVRTRKPNVHLARRATAAVWVALGQEHSRGNQTVTDVVQVRYDELDAVATNFQGVSHAVADVARHVSGSVQPLRAGGWQGAAATAFFAEIEAEIQPALQRLSAALDEAASVTRSINANLRGAEEEAAKLFRGGSVGAQPTAAQSAGSGVLASVADFFEGAWDEGKDMVGGMWHMVRHPIDTAVGLGHAITHPGEMWDAIKKPYVEAWQSGHPWQAVGRGTLFAASFLLGAHGADKVAEAGAIAGRAGELGELAGATGRVGELGELGGATGRVGEIGEVLEPTATAARETFQQVHRQLEEAGWQADARTGAIRPHTTRYPTVEVRPSGDVLGTHGDLTTYLHDTGLTGQRGDVATLESHHLLEDRLMTQFGVAREEGRAVALEAMDHSEFSAELPRHLPRKTFFDIQDVYDAHAQMYREAGHPEWVSETQQFLREQRSTIEQAYQSGNVPGSQFPDFAARRAAALRFLDGL